MKIPRRKMPVGKLSEFSIAMGMGPSARRSWILSVPWVGCWSHGGAAPAAPWPNMAQARGSIGQWWCGRQVSQGDCRDGFQTGEGCVMICRYLCWQHTVMMCTMLLASRIWPSLDWTILRLVFTAKIQTRKGTFMETSLPFGNPTERIPQNSYKSLSQLECEKGGAVLAACWRQLWAC